MESYPVLNAIKRYGKVGSAVIAAVLLVGIAVLLWPFSPILAICLGVVVGAAVLFLALSYVELVRIIAATLMPE